MKNSVNYQKILKPLAPSHFWVDLRCIEKLKVKPKDGVYSNKEIIADPKWISQEFRLFDICTLLGSC